MTNGSNANMDPRFPALVDMLGRMGAKNFTLRYQDDEPPVVWIAAVSFNRQGGFYWDAAGGMTPLSAIYRLVEIFIDGGMCAHCSKPTAITLDQDGMPMPTYICWYQWDPELKTIRRGCE